MTAPATPAEPAHDLHAPVDHQAHYIKIWGVLVVLLIVSVLGPLVGNLYLTLITAFGVALVKAFLVAKHFMHLNLEKRWVTYLLVSMLAFMAIMVAGVAPDVYKHEGTRWENTAAKEVVRAGLAAEHAHAAEQAHPAAHP